MAYYSCIVILHYVIASYCFMLYYQLHPAYRHHCGTRYLQHSGMAPHARTEQHSVLCSQLHQGSLAITADTRVSPAHMSMQCQIILTFYHHVSGSLMSVHMYVRQVIIWSHLSSCFHHDLPRLTSRSSSHAARPRPSHSEGEGLCL